MSYPELDLKRLKVLPLAQRNTLTRLESILIDPESEPPACPGTILQQIRQCALQIQKAKGRHSAVILMYGAHLVKNGAGLIIGKMLTGGWLDHLATNGAGSIHDWEYAFQQASTEPVAENVKNGTFGTWDETGRYIHLALLAGALSNAGYGGSLGQFIAEEKITLPVPAELESQIRDNPAHPLSPARAALLIAMKERGLPGGTVKVPHPGKASSFLAQAFQAKVPLTVHPGIGYDIIANHPMFDGGAIGHAAGIDFRRMGASVSRLSGGVLLCIGSAIMAPQVFEKSLSCVNNLRIQSGQDIISDFDIYVVDLQEGGGWNWDKSEPPKENPAYYLRFMKSFSRMGGRLHYLQCDNRVFIHHLSNFLTVERSELFQIDSPEN
jgi:hypothetical protein